MVRFVSAGWVVLSFFLSRGCFVLGVCKKSGFHKAAFLPMVFFKRWFVGDNFIVCGL